MKIHLIVRILLAATSAATLMSCGQKGPLRLPASDISADTAAVAANAAAQPQAKQP